MKRYQKILFPLIVAAQVLVLAVMILNQELILAHGTKVLLRCRPIDPRSLFSGDYVRLNYMISEIDREIVLQSGIKDTEKLEKRYIYVALKPEQGGRYHTAAAVSESIDELAKRYSIIIRGRVDYAGSTLDVRYGVESYFVPQHEGKLIEENLKDVAVEVSVSKTGESAISRLFIADREVKFY